MLTFSSMRYMLRTNCSKCLANDGKFCALNYPRNDLGQGRHSPAVSCPKPKSKNDLLLAKIKYKYDPENKSRF